MNPQSCVGCIHYLGGGCCRINLEAECAAGDYEMYEGKAERAVADRFRAEKEHPC